MNLIWIETVNKSLLIRPLLPPAGPCSLLIYGEWLDNNKVERPQYNPLLITIMPEPMDQSHAQY